MYWLAYENVTIGLQNLNPVFFPKSSGSVLSISGFATTLWNVITANQLFLVFLRSEECPFFNWYKNMLQKAVVMEVVIKSLGETFLGASLLLNLQHLGLCLVQSKYLVFVEWK